MPADGEDNVGSSAIPRASKKPLIEECTLNQSKDPYMISGLFLSEGLLEALGSCPFKGLSKKSRQTGSAPLKELKLETGLSISC